MLVSLKSRVLALAVAIVGLTGGAASAATVGFSFGGANSLLTTSEVYTAGGVTLTITASDPIHQNPNGIGHSGAEEGNRLSGAETFTLTFSEAVTISALFISEFGNGTDDVSFGGQTFVVNNTGTLDPTVAFGGLSITGTVFTFQNTASTGTLPGVRLEGLEIVSAIPLPAGAFLLIGGLGALGVMRRRRKSA